MIAGRQSGAKDPDWRNLEVAGNLKDCAHREAMSGVRQAIRPEHLRIGRTDSWHPESDSHPTASEESPMLLRTARETCTTC